MGGGQTGKQGEIFLVLAPFWAFLALFGSCKIKVIMSFSPSNIVVQVELGCEEEEDANDGCPPNCVWNGPQGGFLIYFCFEMNFQAGTVVISSSSIPLI